MQGKTVYLVFVLLPARGSRVQTVQEFKRQIRSIRGRRKPLRGKNKYSTLPILNDDESDYRYEDIDFSLP